mgnify:FL=1|tara:strand:+ start:578 stop:862 length:285 start_codon:yes stop_codon:yes gene_type:complete
MAKIKNPGFGSGGRFKSGKQLRQVLGTTIYTWLPTPPDYFVKNDVLDKQKKSVICCEKCSGQIVDNCVTYVSGGQCKEGSYNGIAAYVDCNYVI